MGVIVEGGHVGERLGILVGDVVGTALGLLDGGLVGLSVAEADGSGDGSGVDMHELVLQGHVPGNSSLTL